MGEHKNTFLEVYWSILQIQIRLIPADSILIFYLCIFDILCLADDLHEMPNLIFSEKIQIKNKIKIVPCYDFA